MGDAMVWFPKTPLQWCLLVVAIVIASILIFGTTRGLIISVVALGIYRAVERAIERDQERKISEALPSGGYAKADYGVPHTRFLRTPDGFTVQFSKMGIGWQKALASQTKNPLGALLVLIVYGVVWVIKTVIGIGTRIVVTKDAVIVNGKRMSRQDFGHFNVKTTWKIPTREDTLVVLGYSFGHRGFEFGGAWKEAEGTEVASALNTHLGITPVAGDESQASPAQLRAARPTDF